MTLILIIAIIWGASALIHSAREKRAKENAQRIAAEQARIKRGMREMKERANEEVAARIALEREQMRLAKEQEKERNEREAADAKLRQMVQQVLDDPQYSTKVRCPFRSASEFLPNSDQHVAWLFYDLMGLGDGKDRSTKKEILKTFNMKITDQILECRSLRTLISTFVEKLPKGVASDSRIHCTFNAIGADTGRMSSKNPKHSEYWGCKIRLIQGRATA